MTAASAGAFEPPAIQVTAEGVSGNYTPPLLDDASMANTPEPLSPFSPSSSSSQRHSAPQSEQHSQPYLAYLPGLPDPHQPPWDDEHDEFGISHSADSRAALHDRPSRGAEDGEGADLVSLTSPVLSPGGMASARPPAVKKRGHERGASSLSPSSFSSPALASRQIRAASFATATSPAHSAKPPSPRHRQSPAATSSYSPRKQHPSIARVRSHDVKDSDSPASTPHAPPALLALSHHHSTAAAAAAALSSSSRVIRISPQSSPKSQTHGGQARGFPSPQGSKARTPSHRSSSQMAPDLAAQAAAGNAVVDVDRRTDKAGQREGGKVGEVEVKAGGLSLLRSLYGGLHLMALYVLYYLRSCFPFYPNPPYNIHLAVSSRPSVVSASASLACGRPVAEPIAASPTISTALSAALGFEADFCPKRNLSHEQCEEVMRPKYLQANRLMHAYILCELLVSYVVAVHRDQYIKATAIGGPVVLFAHAMLRLYPYSRATRAAMGMVAQGLVIMNCYHSGGVVEMQYGFFVTFTVLIIYEDWYCVLPACVMVVLDYCIEISLASQGVQTGFMSGIDLYLAPVAVATHVVMLLFQVCLCMLWSQLQRHRTLRDAVQRIRLVEERKQAQKASAAKSDFLSTMSHEIRTPMNGIIGMSELLVECELSAEQHEYAEIIRSSGQSLLSIINDILDFSKIEGHKLLLERIPMNLHRVCEVVCDLLADNAAERRVEFVMRYQPTTPRFIIADPGRIRQICLNLLGNALKFTSTGYVVLNVEVVDAEWEERRRRRQQLRELGGAAGSDQSRLYNRSSVTPSPHSLQDDDPLALPGLSDIIDMQPVVRVHTPPVDAVTATIQQFTRKHLFPAPDSADAVVSAVASGPPPPLFTQPLLPPPQSKRLFTNSARKPQLDLAPQSGLSRASSQSSGTSSSTPSAASSLVLRISVTDSGIGLSADNVQHIFDPFTQADSSTSRKYGGSGLGLAICRRLCHLMGGQLSVHSRIGDGSTFCFTLPIELDYEAIEHHTRMLHAMEKAKQSAAGDRKQPSGQFTHSGRALPISNKPALPGAVPNIELLSGCRVLMADSKELSRVVLLEMLGHHGAKVTALPEAIDAVGGDSTGGIDGPARCSAVLSEVLSEWSRCHLDVSSYYHALLLDADGLLMDAEKWQLFVATLHTEENRRAVDMVQEVSTNSTIVLLVTARQKRRYEEAVASPRVVYLLKPFRETALIRVLTTPHSMHNTRQYDHPSRTSYRSAITSTTSHQPPTKQLPTFSSDATRANGRVAQLASSPASHTHFNSPAHTDRMSVAYSVRPSGLPTASGADSSWYTGDDEPQPDTGDSSHHTDRSQDGTSTLYAPTSPNQPRRPSAAFPLLPIAAVPHKHAPSPSRSSPSPHTQPPTQTMPLRRLVQSSRSNSAHSRSASFAASPALQTSALGEAAPASGGGGSASGSPQNASAPAGGRGMLGSSMSSTVANRSRGPSGASTSDLNNQGRVTPESHNSDSLSANTPPPRKSSRQSPAGNNAAAVIAGKHATAPVTAASGKSGHAGAGHVMRILATNSTAPAPASASSVPPPAALAAPTVAASTSTAVSITPAAQLTIAVPPPPTPTAAPVLPAPPALLPASPSRSSGPASSVTGCRILLVEDTLLNQKVATRILEKLGCTVALARDGQLAVDWMRAHRDAVDVVLMDLNMPVMDGLEATRIIRGDEERGGLVRIPIVAMTADCMPEVEGKCAAVGMDEVTFKPIVAKKVEQVIKHWMRKYRMQLAEAAAAAAGV